MQETRVGRYNTETWIREMELGPYETLRLEAGLETIALTHSNVPELQIIADGRTHRLKMGQCLPANGKLRYIRNPFSKAAVFEIGEGWAPQLLPAGNSADVRFAEAMRSRFANKELSPGSGLKPGVLMMARNSTFDVNVWVSSYGEGLVIPKAKLQYADFMPENLNNDGIATYRDGSENHDVVIKHGYYSPSDMNQWKLEANWIAEPVGVTTAGTRVDAMISPDTALIVTAAYNRPLEVDAEFIELGNFNAEGR